MDIPWEQLSPDTLTALIEEFVSREGTDYGRVELAFNTKVNQVREMIRKGKVKVVFDAETESVDLREVQGKL